MAEDIKTPYRVLARKYRPRNFDEVVGQDALVRTLKNAIESGRIAHAYMLTGIRGTGKTTTARIIARALNYTGPDGKAGPTTGPTDDCAVCRSIAEDRCPDVLEMDAASRTGVDDIREITDGVRYAPSVARYKVYIIDEVHMLSKAAFNALLKTLEEPPPHVIFIFATTEIRKVPVTVLSRCQRFDLRRVDGATLSAYYGKICGLEKVAAEPEALALISRAADGSVRDGLSLLDQAIALGSSKIDAQLVRDMLGLADRTQVMDLLEHALKGECAQALAIMDGLYRSGADASVVMQDMLDFTHLLTRLRAVPETKNDPSALLTGDAMARAAEMAAALGMPALGRAWQVLLKGLAEVNAAPNPQAAAEMIVIRLAYAADLPDPADLLKRLKNMKDTGASSNASFQPSSSDRHPEPVGFRSIAGGGGQTMAVAQPVAMPQQNVAIASLADIEALLSVHGHVRLAGEVFHSVHLVKLEEGRLEIRPDQHARPELAAELGKALTSVCGTRWMVTVNSVAAGGPTLAEEKAQVKNALILEARDNPVVKSLLALFPGAEISITEES